MDKSLDAFALEHHAALVLTEQLAFLEQIDAGDERPDRNVRRQSDRRAKEAAADERDAEIRSDVKALLLLQTDERCLEIGKLGGARGSYAPT